MPNESRSSRDARLWELPGSKRTVTARPATWQVRVKSAWSVCRIAELIDTLVDGRARGAGDGDGVGLARLGVVACGTNGTDVGTCGGAIGSCDGVLCMTGNGNMVIAGCSVVDVTSCRIVVRVGVANRDWVRGSAEVKKTWGCRLK